MNNQRSDRTVRVYACGGCGVNIGQLLEEHRESKDLSISAFDIAYVDTSRSNLNDATPDEHVYLLEGVDGSGKIRRENHQEIAKRTGDILSQFQPKDLNVVIHSASGGSGSVFAPSIVSELIAKKHPTVALLVGSADTALDAKNTLNTLKSYEAIADLREAPVAVVYLQNSRANKREDVNKNMLSIAVSLGVLFSGNNRELDRKDLYNFLNFHVTTSYLAQLVHLTLAGPDELDKIEGHVISVATLVRDGQESAIEPTPEVQFVGYIRDDSPKGVLENVPLHFVLTDGIFEAVDKSLNLVLKGVADQQQSRVARGKILSDADKPTASGLVL